MRYNKLGRTGLFVSQLCLGTMTFGGANDMWGKLGQGEADKLVRLALDAGVNFIDTADVYAGGASERIVGQALRNLSVERRDVVIATKAFGPTGDGVNQRGASRAHLIDACHASLERLQLDHIDLYQIHGFDPATPMEETLRTLDTLVRDGVVSYIGVSNWAAWQVAKALGISGRHELARFEALQSYYTLVGRDLEREIVPMLMSEEVGLLVWSPLAGGFLSGKYQAGGTGPEDGRRSAFQFPPVDDARGAAAINVMRGIAKAKQVSMAQVALAWLLHQPVVTSVIIGAKKPEQLVDNLGATEVTLTPEELASLKEVTGLPAEYPGWMQQQQGGYRADQLAQSGRTRRG